MKRIAASILFIVLFSMISVSCSQKSDQNALGADDPTYAAATIGITVYTSGYTHIYWWNPAPSGSAEVTSWPGVLMGTDAASGLKTYSFPNATSINLIFSNNGGGQTADLTRTSGAWRYSSGTWTAYSTGPSATALPGTSSFNAPTLSVTLYAANPATGTYQIDSGTATSYNNGAVVIIDGAALSAGQSRTLTVKNGTASNTYVYTKSSSGITVFTSTYTNIYWWNSAPANSPANTTWPGAVMGTDAASGLKTYSFPSATSINLIFSNNGSGQTADLSRTTGAWLYSNGAWSAYNPGPGASATPGSSSFASSISITLGATNPANGTYQWDSGAAVAYTNGTIITAGSDWSINQSKTLIVKNGTASNSYTYTKSGTASTINIYYKSSWASAAPTIWIWEGTGTTTTVTPSGNRSVSAILGFTWPGPAMTKDSSQDWWYYTIPTQFYPLTNGLNIKFASGAQVTLSGAVTASQWWNGTAWSLSNPDPATAPTVTMSPNGGWTTGTSIDVTVTVSASVKAPVTVMSYKINSGSSVSFTANPNKITVPIAAGSTSTLTVSATNSVGTTTVTSLPYNQGTQPVPTFTWDNATVYFAITDRFNNGNTANDNSYGRIKVDATGKNIGTFHGGDLAGMTAKLNAGYFTDLGINAIWITAPYEQIHGWCGGGPGGDFAHYAYHGYYALDYTEMDKNMGTAAELRAFVTAAHSKGIRVIFDIVMNHAGYNTLKDMEEYNFGLMTGITSAWTPASGQTWHSYHTNIDYTTAAAQTAWARWWGTNWVRTGIIGYTAGDGSEIQMQLAGLPDFRTELTSAQPMAPIMTNKWAKETTGYADWINPSAASLRNGSSSIVPVVFLQKALAAWVREFGIDGFRCDTAKHVELNRWKELKDACIVALNDWRKDTTKSAGDPAKTWTENFWMTGEVWGHGVGRSAYFDNGFDSIINFTFPKDGNLGSIGGVWQGYADAINVSRTFNVLSYISSHDTGLTRGNNINIATCFMLSPGAIQIFYGDESARTMGETGSDPYQGTRSDMNWSGTDTALLAHWQKLGKFRLKHFAVGGGVQTTLAANTYSRVYTKGTYTDKVVICLTSGSMAVNVSGIFADGTTVRNAYDGTTAVVSGGSVTLGGTIKLIEQAL